MHYVNDSPHRDSGTNVCLCVCVCMCAKVLIFWELLPFTVFVDWILRFCMKRAVVLIYFWWKQVIIAKCYVPRLHPTFLSLSVFTISHFPLFLFINLTFFSSSTFFLSLTLFLLSFSFSWKSLSTEFTTGPDLWVWVSNQKDSLYNWLCDCRSQPLSQCCNKILSVKKKMARIQVFF